MSQVHPKRRESFARRWRELCEKTTTLDYEKAELASEVRAEFPHGPSGDYQFRRWIMGTFDIAGPTASKFTRAARAFKRFTREIWFMVGGWAGISLANSLSTTDSTRLLHAVRARREELGRDLTYHQVRMIAFDIGIKSANTGRPSHTQTEEKLGHLRAWLKNLYKTYNNLLPMPEHVAVAMNASKLARMAASQKKSNRQLVET